MLSYITIQYYWYSLPYNIVYINYPTQPRGSIKYAPDPTPSSGGCLSRVVRNSLKWFVSQLNFSFVDYFSFIARWLHWSQYCVTIFNVLCDKNQFSLRRRWIILHEVNILHKMYLCLTLCCVIEINITYCYGDF